MIMIIQLIAEVGLLVATIYLVTVAAIQQHIHKDSKASGIYLVVGITTALLLVVNTFVLFGKVITLSLLAMLTGG